MRVTETRTREYQATTAIRCDICGREVQESNWVESYWGVEETEGRFYARRWTGEQYPEGGWGEVWEFDICPTCFAERLIPWLREQGVNVEPSEWKW